MDCFLGIDIGGTNVKFGLVNDNGELLEKTKVKTSQMKEGGFMRNFIVKLRQQLETFPKIKKVGIGIPGTINKERTATFELTNLSELNNLSIIEQLNVAFPTITFYMENDANVAAIGEYYFGAKKLPKDYIFITLGTGIGGAAVINRRIFKGGNGNSMEIGHIIAGNGKTVEQNIGKAGIIAATEKALKNYKGDSILSSYKKLDAKKIVEAAQQGDTLALDIFKMVGTGLGECLVSNIRVLDIQTIVIGGGLAKAFPYIKKAMYIKIEEFLTPYYLKELDIRLATLANDAGIIGAASLCLDD